MAKWILDQYTGPELDYPSLGFRADVGEILDATAAPDAKWSLHSNQAAAETVTRYTIGYDPSYIEPGDGHILTYSDPDNAYVPTDQGVLVDAITAEAQAHADAAAAHRAAVEAVVATNDGIMASAVNDPTSNTNTALAARYSRRREYDPRNYGNFAEGSTWQVNRDALQAANDAAYAAGGGRVAIPPGTYSCKGVIQDSHVEFYGPLAKLSHPDGTDTDIIRGRLRTTTATVTTGGSTVTVADATGIEKGSLIAIRGAGGISRLQNAGLGSAITSAQTTGITLGSSTGFPTSGYLVIGTEIIGYTGLVGNTLEGVTRGEFGTVAAAHAVGAQTGVALRHITQVTAVSGTTLNISTPAVLGVTAAPATTGAVRPKISYLSFDGNRVTNGAASTLNPVRWDLVRWGEMEWQYVEDAESAFYLAQGTSDCTIAHVVARNCSVPEASKGAVGWFFQQCHRNRLEDIRIYEGVWSGIYFDNRTTLGTEWDGGCDDNTVDGYHIFTPYLGSGVSNSGVLVVGGSRNKLNNGTVDGVRTALVIEAAAQINNTDGYLPPATKNSVNGLKHLNGYQPYVISTAGNMVNGLTYDTAADGTAVAGNLFVASAITPGGNPVIGRNVDGTQTAPGIAFLDETNTGFYRIAAGQVQFVSQGVLGVRLTSTGLRFTDSTAAALIDLGTTNGTKIGSGTTQKLGFYGTTPIVRPTGTPGAASDLATAITLVNSLRASLLNLGLVGN